MYDRRRSPTPDEDFDDNPFDDIVGFSNRRQREETPEKVQQMEEPKTSKKWTPRKEKTLCLLWEEEGHLYNACHPDYRNSNRRRTTIERIAAGLNMEGIKNNLKLINCKHYIIPRIKTHLFVCLITSLVNFTLKSFLQYMYCMYFASIS